MQGYRSLVFNRARPFLTSEYEEDDEGFCRRAGRRIFGAVTGLDADRCDELYETEGTTKDDTEDDTSSFSPEMAARFSDGYRRLHGDIEALQPFFDGERDADLALNNQAWKEALVSWILFYSGFTYTLQYRLSKTFRQTVVYPCILNCYRSLDISTFYEFVNMFVRLIELFLLASSCRILTLLTGAASCVSISRLAIRSTLR